jgi:DNA-binding NtrC family response regulator
VNRILVVEDEKVFADILEIVLSHGGYDVRIALGVDEAIAQAAEYRPDVLITDWVLRDKRDGGFVAEAIRSHCPHVKTIVITGYRDVACSLREDPQGIREVIEKPFQVAQVLEAVRRALAMPSGVR